MHLDINTFFDIIPPRIEKETFFKEFIMEIFTKSIEIFQKLFSSIPIQITINITLSIIIFIPDKLAKLLALETFRTTFRKFLGPIFILFFSMLIVNIILHYKKKYEKIKIKKIKNKMLHSLTPEEKNYLRVYIIEKKNTLYPGISDGIMGGLEAKNITYRASSLGDHRNGFPYNLQPWAREYLEKNKYLIDDKMD